MVPHELAVALREAEIGICIPEFGYPGLAEGNVVNSHIQFDFPRSL